MLGVLLGLVFTTHTSAQTPPSAQTQPTRDPTRLFPHVAEVEAAASGLVRLPLPADVIARVHPDLSDLRLFDAEGTELPFFVDRGRDAWPTDVSPRIPLPLLDVQERDARRLEPTSFQELHVALPPPPPDGARWMLEVDAPVDRFVRQVVVSLEDERGVVELARGSVFRLPSSSAGPARSRLRIALPSLPTTAATTATATPATTTPPSPTPSATPNATGPRPRLVVAIHGEGPLLSPTLHLVGERASAPRETLSVPLTVLRTERVDGRTVIELARPVGLVPESVVIGTSDRNFHRTVIVADLRRGREPLLLGRGSVHRLTLSSADLAGTDANAPTSAAETFDLHDEDLTIPLTRARGEVLRVTIEDGDAASLRDLSFTAEIRRPALVFTHRPGTRLLFGGGRSRPRQHDLEALVGTSLGEEILERPLPEATLGPAQANPTFDDRPALGFARAGRAVDVAPYAAMAELVVRDAREGASHFLPSSALLGRARADLADLRVVDGEGNAWPYVLSPAETLFEQSLGTAPPTTTARRSVHAITSEHGPLPVARLLVDPEERYVSRAYVLFGIDPEGERRRLASGVLEREPENDAPIAIELPAVPEHASPRPSRRRDRLFGSRYRDAELPDDTRARFATFELEVEDGDDRPLTLRDARAELVTRTVFLAAPDGTYRVLVGHREAEPPRYELDAALDLVLAVESVPAMLGDVRDNPRHEPPAFWSRPGLSTSAVWAVLIFAVVLLGAMTLRLARAGADDAHAPPTPPPQTPTENETSAPEATPDPAASSDDENRGPPESAP